MSNLPLFLVGLGLALFVGRAVAVPLLARRQADGGRDEADLLFRSQRDEFLRASLPAPRSSAVRLPIGADHGVAKEIEDLRASWNADTFDDRRERVGLDDLAARFEPLTRLTSVVAIAAGASLLLSVSLWFGGRPDEGVFVGLWVPTILAVGILATVATRLRAGSMMSRTIAKVAVAAGASLVLSVSLWFGGRPDEGLFVGLWVPTILAVGALVPLGRLTSEQLDPT